VGLCVAEHFEDVWVIQLLRDLRLVLEWFDVKVSAILAPVAQIDLREDEFLGYLFGSYGFLGIPVPANIDLGVRPISKAFVLDFVPIVNDFSCFELQRLEIGSMI